MKSAASSRCNTHTAIPQDGPVTRTHGARIPWQNLVGSRSGVLLGHAAEVLRSNKVYEPFVLLFNPGQHDEGVYTLQGRESLITTYVLAFEQQDEADRFAMLLQVRTAALLLPHLAHATNALAPPSSGAGAGL